jgi:hypothetical protein
MIEAYLPFNNSTKPSSNNYVVQAWTKALYIPFNL